LPRRGEHPGEVAVGEQLALALQCRIQVPKFRPEAQQSNYRSP
jgi:hypothetical protein